MRKTKEKIIDMYVNGNLGIKMISEKTGLCVSTVAYHLKNTKKNKQALNYKTGPTPRIGLDIIVDLYYDKGKTITEIGSILKYDSKTISGRLIRGGYKLRKRGSIVNNLLNHNYFSTNNICGKSMYWVGFIVGDGNISGNRVSIFQRYKYKNILEDFRNDILGGSKILVRVSKSPSFKTSGTMCKSATIRVVSDKMIADLKLFGIAENKSVIGGKLDIQKHKNSFLLGLLDSDGWVGYSGGRYSIGWCGHLDTMLEVQTILKDELNIIINVVNHGNIKQIVTSNKKYIKAISKYLLSGGVSLIDYKLEKLINIGI